MLLARFTKVEHSSEQLYRQSCLLRKPQKPFYATEAAIAEKESVSSDTAG
ncbi:MAG: hypothetical protein F6K04_09440 [Leptolyngbya sp. SIO4C5]|nr:hypothetical protein [Leptolyngbya sp. SIO4C5]